MSEYASVRVGKLRLKGAAGAGLGTRKKKSKRKREQHGEENEGLRHGLCVSLYRLVYVITSRSLALARSVAPSAVDRENRRPLSVPNVHRRLPPGRGHRSVPCRRAMC